MDQFAFRKGYSTEHAVDKLSRTVERLKLRARHVLLPSFDVSSAFNKIKWSFIVNRINKSLIKLLQNFLINRTLG